MHGEMRNTCTVLFRKSHTASSDSKVIRGEKDMWLDGRDGCDDAIHQRLLKLSKIRNRSKNEHL